MNHKKWNIFAVFLLLLGTICSLGSCKQKQSPTHSFFIIDGHFHFVELFAVPFQINTEKFINNQITSYTLCNDTDTIFMYNRAKSTALYMSSKDYWMEIFYSNGRIDSTNGKVGPGITLYKYKNNQLDSIINFAYTTKYEYFEDLTIKRGGSSVDSMFYKEGVLQRSSSWLHLNGKIKEDLYAYDKSGKPISINITSKYPLMMNKIKMVYDEKDNLVECTSIRAIFQMRFNNQGILTELTYSEEKQPSVTYRAIINEL